MERNLTIACRGHITIGNDCFIGEGAMIVARESVSIGNDCLIAAGVTIRDMTHGIELNGTLFRDQETTTKPISIGHNVWLGAKATVLLGVEIGDNSVLGAHGLAIKSIPANAVAVGIPAKIVKQLE